jgi:excisionase family DNA binding protein
MNIQLRDVTAPSDDLAAQAKEAARALSGLLQAREPSVTLRPAEGTGRVTVPREAFELFVDILSHLANGNAVAVFPVHAELTTQQSADLLNVSRPYFVRLLEDGKIPFHKTGTHRRVKLQDLLAYKKDDDARRKAAVDELTSLGQDEGLE